MKAEIRHSPVDVRELLIRTVHGFPWRTLIPLVACIGVFCFLLLAPVSPLSISPNPPREFTRQTLYALGSSAEDPAWTIDVINNENLRILSDSTVRMVVTKDGRVGIGTSNPALALDVQGGWLRVGSGSSAIQLETQSGFHRIAFENLNFWDWSYGSMVTFVDGKVGIGTTAPSQTLHVEGRVYIGDNVSIKNTTPDHPLVVGPASGGRHLVINGIAGARWGLATGGYDLSFQSDYGTWNTKVIFTKEGYVWINGSDLALGLDDGRSKGSQTGQRALVHGSPGDIDQLVINYDGDFEGGVWINPGYYSGLFPYFRFRAIPGKVFCTYCWMEGGMGAELRNAPINYTDINPSGKADDWGWDIYGYVKPTISNPIFKVNHDDGCSFVLFDHINNTFFAGYDTGTNPFIVNTSGLDTDTWYMFKLSGEEESGTQRVNLQWSTDGGTNYGDVPASCLAAPDPTLWWFLCQNGGPN
ncbi:MAG: hypothetical protein QW356_03355 [Candidatus Hadarchaeales archaeon]